MIDALSAAKASAATQKTTGVDPGMGRHFGAGRLNRRRVSVRRLAGDEGVAARSD